MIEAIYESNTGLDASQASIDTAGNNLANLNTTSFKANRILFQDLFYQTLNPPGLQNPVGTQRGNGVQVSSTDKQFTQGALQNTGRNLDVAINGQGFLQVKLPDGSIAYTRDGTLGVNSAGQLVTATGFIVQPPITFPANYEKISIGADGTVKVTTANAPNTFQTIGQITLAGFANPPGLTSIGNNLYAASGASGAPVISVPGQGGTGTLQQGFLESSNVNPVTELTNLIIAQETFSANSQAIVVANEMLQSTVELVALT